MVRERNARFAVEPYPRSAADGCARQGVFGRERYTRMLHGHLDDDLSSFLLLFLDYLFPNLYAHLYRRRTCANARVMIVSLAMRESMNVVSYYEIACADLRWASAGYEAVVACILGIRIL